jgi:hypothetical protein
MESIVLPRTTSSIRAETALGEPVWATRVRDPGQALSMTARSTSTWEGSFLLRTAGPFVSVGSPVGICGEAWR